MGCHINAHLKKEKISSLAFRISPLLVALNTRWHFRAFYNWGPHLYSKRVHKQTCAKKLNNHCFCQQICIHLPQSKLDFHLCAAATCFLNYYFMNNGLSSDRPFRVPFYLHQHKSCNQNCSEGNTFPLHTHFCANQTLTRILFQEDSFWITGKWHHGNGTSLQLGKMYNFLPHQPK